MNSNNFFLKHIPISVLKYLIIYTCIFFLFLILTFNPLVASAITLVAILWGEISRTCISSVGESLENIKKTEEEKESEEDDNNG